VVDISNIRIDRILPVMAVSIDETEWSLSTSDPEDLSSNRTWKLIVAYSLPSCSLCTLFEAIRKKSSELTDDRKAMILVQLAQLLLELHSIPVTDPDHARSGLSGTQPLFSLGLAHLRLNSASVFVCHVHQSERDATCL
jgi:hypothetical protein